MAYYVYLIIGHDCDSYDGFESITGTEDACKYRQELTSTGDVITTVAGNPTQNRTVDTTIFSRMLYQLSYLGIPLFLNNSTILVGNRVYVKGFGIFVTRTGIGP